MKGKQKSKFKCYKNLYRILYPQLSALAYQHIKDLKVSQEIVQEVFLNRWADYTVFDDENEVTVLLHDAIIDVCTNNRKDKLTSKFKSCRDLFKSLYPQLSAIAFMHVKDFVEAKEIVQEVFLNAWANYSELDDENDTIIFFYDAVVNQCVELIKTKQIKVIALDMATKPTMESSEETIVDPSEVIENMLSKLPKEKADAIKRDIEDYK